MTSVAARVGRWLRGLWPRETEPRDARALIPRQPVTVEGSVARDWVQIESVGVASIGAMYADLLRQEGIPVLVREWGAGSAAFGGMPVGVRLFVPSDRVADARELLGEDVAEEDVDER